MAVPRRVRKLYKIPKLSQKFETAFDQFYDDAEQEGVVDDLHGAELEEFLGFLDEVLQLEGLNPELFRKALYSLWNTCSRRGILPKSHMISEGLSRTGDGPLASGGYADVWVGELTRGNSDPRRVCIKAMRTTKYDGEKLEKVWCGEVSVWMRLKHPNIVPCLGAATNPFQIVMDLMSNGEVMDYAKRNSNANRVHLALGLAEGLDYLHSRGLIHGDLKPGNVLVNARGDACISDFGLAVVTRNNRVTEDEEPTARGHSTLWAAPETLKDGQTSKEADVFSYGLVAVEIFKGESPWGQATVAQVMTKIVLGERPARPESTKALGLTTELWNGLTKCWHVNPKERVTIPEILVLLRYVSRTGLMGTSRSELSIDGPLESMTDGMVESTSIPRRLSNTYPYQRFNSHTALPAGGPSNHHSGLIGPSEKTVASHPKTTYPQGGSGARTPRGVLGRCRGISAIGTLLR